MDIDCDWSESISLDSRLESLDWVVENYPVRKDRFTDSWELPIGTGGAEPTLNSHRLIARQFFQPDERQLFQVREDGFSFNRLAPYSSFDDYIPEIRSLWEGFSSKLSPLSVRQIRLRNINRICLPGTTQHEFNKYFVAAPQNPYQVQGFLLRQDMIHPSGVRVISVLSPQIAGIGGVEVLLDIHVLTDISCSPGDWDQILDALSRLRAVKNELFLSSLTSKGQELLQSC